ncbi:5-histidylcysteine sulfoxide synthase [Prochlorothrix hollandica]|uniref:5-histidylcysteine sulfoxide synthase n=1 Tax=Prochlorothrix hollandica TaxID=1223 RepID=UPI00034D4190|nr:5-histidylcysteine sulfoxide synthase [Prochlorothrix hollandica]
MNLSAAVATAEPDPFATSPLDPPRLDACGRDDLRQYFRDTWAWEDGLMQTLVGEEPWYQQPDRLRNPLVFYLGHSPSFYVDRLCRVGLMAQPVNPDLETLFGIGVDPDTPAELAAVIEPLQWPSLEQVWHYRHQVREAVAAVIDRAPLTLPIDPDSPLWALIMGMEHSRVHLETSSMLFRQLPPQHLQRPPHWTYAPTPNAAPPNPLLELQGGLITLGKPWSDPYYGWDMEYGYRQERVQPFAASVYLVSNQEFLGFVEAGGYGNPAYWGEKGWAWAQGLERDHPAFWLRRSPGNYGYRTVFEVIDLPWSWPVEVNHYEAMAFCRWRGEGFRLLTEAEWTWAAAVEAPQSPDAWDYEAFNLNLRFGSPSAVGSVATAKSATGLYDLRGNVWEWLGDNFNTLPGFQAHDLYPDHARLYCDPDHWLMLGGSWISNGTMAAPTYRNWFRPQFYQHAGFRVARDLP